MIAKQLLGLGGDDADGGGESLLDGGGASLLGGREVAQLSLQARRVHFVGAFGGPQGGHRIGPDIAGPLLAAMGGIWRDFALNKASPQMYGRVRRACTRRGGDSSVCAFSPA